MSTDWAIRITTIVGDDLGYHHGVVDDRANAATRMFAAAHDCVDAAGDTAPIYVLHLDGDMVGFVATGRRHDAATPDHHQAHARLNQLEPRIVTAALCRN